MSEPDPSPPDSAFYNPYEDEPAPPQDRCQTGDLRYLCGCQDCDAERARADGEQEGWVP